MKRRKFIAAAAATSLTAPSVLGGSLATEASGDNEIYELRTYELAWPPNRAALTSYLTEVEAPYLKSHGVNHYLTFSEPGHAEPTKLWVLISYPNFTSYQHAISNRSDQSYLQQSADYTEAGKIYTRITSSLLYAIDGLKQLLDPIDNAQLFELRIYDGVNEDAVRRKIKMFNDEELVLFDKVDLNPIFFGNMVIGPYVPSLVYMLNYRNMEHRVKAWKDFLEHPDWISMRDRQEYANTVSNIRKVFLELVS